MYDAHCRYFMIYYLLLLRKFRMPSLLFVLPGLVNLYYGENFITTFRPRTLKIFNGEQIHYIENQET